MKLIFLFSVFTFAKSGNILHKNVLEGFKFCLVTKGVNPNSIVEQGNSETYNRINYQWLLKPPFITPLAFVLVQNAENVVAVVSCGREWNLRLMPKGGGHSMEKYSFGDTNTVVVDTRNLKTLKIQKKSATVGSGWLIGPLTFELWKMGKVCIPFTECPTVGIAGLATGGGWGFLARKFGLITDSLLGVQIVIPNGTLLTVNSKRNSDLFWALRGGVGSNFGILTTLKFRTHQPPPTLFYASLTYDMNQFKPVFDAWQKYAPSAPNSMTLALFVKGGKVHIGILDTTGKRPNFEMLARKFPRNPSNVESTVYKYPQFIFFNYRNLSGEEIVPQTGLHSLSDMANLNRESPVALYHKRKSFYVTNKIGSAQLRQLDLFVQRMPTSVSVFLESYGGAINNYVNTATAFVHREGVLYNVIAQCKNYDGNSTAQVEATRWVEEFFEFSKGVFQHKESYQNYVDGDLGDYLERYFGSNLHRLVQVKKKYDPENYWRNPQSIPTRL